jgi:Uma2 family endonuclease
MQPRSWRDCGYYQSMPAVLTPSHEPEVIRRKVWNREQCAVLSTAGVFDFEHLELIEGDLVEKMGKNRPHSIASIMLLNWAFQTFGKAYVNAETAIDVASTDNPTNAPEPDLFVLAEPMWRFKTMNPGPADIRLLVEVSDSSLAFDLRTKAKLYARAGIVEYWVLDVNEQRLIVHRDPQPDGRFGFVMAYGENETVSPMAAPATKLLVAELFAEED